MPDIFNDINAAAKGAVDHAVTSAESNASKIAQGAVSKVSGKTWLIGCAIVAALIVIAAYIKF